jgi:hypothetical protein
MVILDTHPPTLPFSVNIVARSDLSVGEKAYTYRFGKSASGTRTFQPHRNPSLLTQRPINLLPSLVRLTGLDIGHEREEALGQSGVNEHRVMEQRPWRIRHH